MGCYNCGSDKGTSTRLCPDCIAARNNAMASRTAEMTNRRAGSTSSSKLITMIGGGILAVLVVVFAGYYFLFSESGPGFLLPKYVRIQNLCKKTVAKEMKKARSETAKEIADSKGSGDFADLGEEFAKGMAELAVGMVEGFSGAVCEMEAEECRKEPSTCDAVIRRLEKELKK